MTKRNFLNDLKPNADVSLVTNVEAVSEDSSNTVGDTLPTMPVEAPVVTVTAVTPPKPPSSPAEVRQALLDDKITEFKVVYPVGIPMTPPERVAMVRAIETMIIIALNSETYPEMASQVSKLRATFFENAGNVFERSRIIGHMREPRSGALNVQYERTVNLATLLYMTANPKTFQAHKGRTDISHAVVGCTESAATMLRQYFG